MYRQIIHPEKKEDLVITLPDSFLGKGVEVVANEVEKGEVDEAKRDEFFTFLRSLNVKTKG